MSNQTQSEKWCDNGEPPTAELASKKKSRNTEEQNEYEEINVDIESIDQHLQSFQDVADRALEWSSKKPYLQDLFAGWLEGKDVAAQTKVIKDIKLKWWSMTQSPDLVRQQLSNAVFGAVAIVMNAPIDKAWSSKRIREEPTFPLTMLLQHGANPSALSSPGPDGGTPLHWLADMAPDEEEDSQELRQRQVELGRILLDHGADVNAKMGDGMDRCTPLHKACSSRAGVNIPFIDLLLNHGANVNALTREGYTFLLYSIPYNLTAAWHVLNAASDKLETDLFLGEITDALAEERMKYLVETHELQDKTAMMLVTILEDLREELSSRDMENQSYIAEVVKV